MWDREREVDKGQEEFPNDHINRYRFALDFLTTHIVEDDYPDILLPYKEFLKIVV